MWKALTMPEKLKYSAAEKSKKAGRPSLKQKDSKSKQNVEKKGTPTRRNGADRKQ